MKVLLVTAVLVLACVSGAKVAFAAPVLLDDFNRSDAAIGANWTGGVISGVGIPQIIGNAAATGDGGFAEKAGTWNAATYASDAQVGWTMKSSSGYVTGVASYGLLGVSAVGSGFTGYLCNVAQVAGGPIVQLYRSTAGTFTQLGADTSTAAFASGDTFACSKAGAVITLTHNGTTVLSVTDTSPLSGGGYAGFGVRGAALSVDDFTAGDSTTEVEPDPPSTDYACPALDGNCAAIAARLDLVWGGLWAAIGMAGALVVGRLMNAEMRKWSGGFR